jgi:hypothetical protein
VSLRKRWRDLDRATIGRAPDRYGVYELGDESGEVIELGSGHLRDELKEALAYGRAAKVRWQAANSREHAKRLEGEHRD